MGLRNKLIITGAVFALVGVGAGAYALDSNQPYAVKAAETAPSTDIQSPTEDTMTDGTQSPSSPDSTTPTGSSPQTQTTETQQTQQTTQQDTPAPTIVSTKRCIVEENLHSSGNNTSYEPDMFRVDTYSDGSTAVTDLGSAVDVSTPECANNVAPVSQPSP